MNILKVLLFLEILASYFWVIPNISQANLGLGALLLFVYLYAPQLCFMGVSVYFLIKKPSEWKLPVAVIVLPIIVLFLPVVVKALVGPVAMSNDGMGIASVAAVGTLPVACLFLPHKLGSIIPRGLLQSRGLNVALCVILVVLAVPWVLMLAGALLQHGGKQAKTDLLVATGLYSVALLVPAVLTFFYSYLALFQKVARPQKKLWVSQMVISVALCLISLPAILMFVFIAGMAGMG